MKPSTKDLVKGMLEQLKGKMKDVAGLLTGRYGLAGEGKDQRLAGKAQQKLGQVEKVIGE